MPDYHIDLGPELEHLPCEDEQMKKKKVEVEMKFGMLQGFAIINGTHVSILKPREYSTDFNYKGFHSITMQASL